MTGDENLKRSSVVLRADGVASAVASLPPRYHLGGDKIAPVSPDDAAAVGVHAIRVSAVAAVLFVAIDKVKGAYGWDKRAQRFRGGGAACWWGWGSALGCMLLSP